MQNPFFALSCALISPEHLANHLARLETHRASFSALIHRLDDSNDDAAPWWRKVDLWGDPLPAPSRVGRTAIIPVKGVLTSGMPTLYRVIHFADTEEIAGWVRTAREDSTINRIVMPYDSPGGMYAGTPELAAEIRDATLVKRVVAYTKGMMDSAAYWAASQSNEVYCTPSGDVGCIGVYQMHYDFSAALEKIGVKAEMFKSGDLKGSGHPDIPLSTAQRENIQKDIATIGAEFRAAVKRKRPLVEADSMRGQSFIGSDAFARRLVDGNVRALQELVGEGKLRRPSAHASTFEEKCKLAASEPDPWKRAILFAEARKFLA